MKPVPADEPLTRKTAATGLALGGILLVGDALAFATAELSEIEIVALVLLFGVGSLIAGYVGREVSLVLVPPIALGALLAVTAVFPRPPASPMNDPQSGIAFLAAVVAQSALVAVGVALARLPTATHAERARGAALTAGTLAVGGLFSTAILAPFIGSVPAVVVALFARTEAGRSHDRGRQRDARRALVVATAAVVLDIALLVTSG